jgi:hypothetical protein
LKAIVQQFGDIPESRHGMARNAFAGAKVLCDLLAEKDFADLCTITLDFYGDGFTPVVELHTTKWVPRYSPQNLQHVWSIDMDEVFGQDNADNALLRQIVSDVEYAMRAEEEARDKVDAARKTRIEL